MEEEETSDAELEEGEEVEEEEDPHSGQSNQIYSVHSLVKSTRLILIWSSLICHLKGSSADT